MSGDILQVVKHLVWLQVKINNTYNAIVIKIFFRFCSVLVRWPNSKLCSLTTYQGNLNANLCKLYDLKKPLSVWYLKLLGWCDDYLITSSHINILTWLPYLPGDTTLYPSFITKIVRSFYYTDLFCNRLHFIYRDKLFPESTVRNIVYQVLQGLVFMHKHGE